MEKGNPKNINNLEDLSRSGLKVGIADRKKSALGALTYNMLEQEGELAALEASKNLKVLVAKGDDLVNQMQLGALDAALLYKSNAMASPSIMQHCKIIMLGNDYATAEQPYAVAEKADHAQLMVRLGEYLTTDQAKETFVKYGFKWVLEERE